MNEEPISVVAAATPDLESDVDQSAGTDPRTKRNSGLFAFFKWFKPGSRESIQDGGDSSSRSSGSLESVASDKSSGTVASFRYVSPIAYENKVLQEKQLVIGPETDTYKARLKQRDKRRESDKNVTLRKKYNLFFNKETLLKPQKPLEESENSKSLPLMTRAHVMEVEPQKVHRRTNSESSKMKRAGAYVHVKGKRRAPQPPGTGCKLPQDSSSTASLKRKKRVAPAPPPSTEKEIVANDCLKLDHGVLKPVKDDMKSVQNNPVGATLSPSSSKSSFFVEAPVSPKPWYKRNSTSKEVLIKKENKYEPIERLPEVQYMRNSTLDLTMEDSLANLDKTKKKDEKRKSAMSFLTNISELDREASEIIKNKTELGLKNNNELSDIPEFMKLKDAKPNDSLVSPKRRSARDLIAKFNAITGVSKSSVFGSNSNHKDKFFGKQISLDESKVRQEKLLENHKKRIEDIDKKKEDKFAPLMKSESASAVKLGANKETTPKLERKSWKCPKCNLDNEYWRIICHVCSAIKPYFDDFSSSSSTSKVDAKTPKNNNSSPITVRKENNSLFERSKTQIGFSALATYGNNNNNRKSEPAESDDCKVDESSKKEERERLKKMLIEMKNSLPKRKTNMLMKQNSRTNANELASKEIEQIKEETDEDDKKEDKTQEEKVAEILIGTSQTIYENIKVRKTENPKPIKVSSSAQTSAVMKKIVPESTLKKLIETHKANNIYEPMRMQDFEHIYSDKHEIKNPARIYANLAQNDELSLFFNVPKNITNMKNHLGDSNSHHTDTIEINRLLRRLESAIAKGEMVEAATFAKELAQLKVNCSVIRQKAQSEGSKTKGFQVEMYVEDKVSHRGPFPIDVTETETVAELKEQIAKEFEIPVEVQRWILGKELVVNEETTLKQHGITTGCPVFLYLVAPEKKPKETANDKLKQAAFTPKAIASKEETTAGNKIEPKTEENIIKSKAEAPKVVNVIPKSSEPTQAAPEVVRVIPIQKSIQKPVTTKPQPPISLTEIKVDIKPYTTRHLQEAKEEKTGLFRAKTTKVEVLQAPAVMVPNTSRSQSTQQIYKTENETRLLSESAETAESRVGHVASKPTQGLYPNLAIDKSTHEEYDSNTLKPQKEWECHLCTLLNPDSSNICAVCAAVRVKKAASLKRPNKKGPAPQPRKDQTYLQLVNLDSADLVPNADIFECKVCFLDVAKGEGVTLRECLHQFCKQCLSQTIEYAEDAEVKCPYRDDEYSCNIALQDREIKALVTPALYEQYLAKSVAQAENKMEKTFHCKTPDCKGWCIFEDNVNEFRCPVCRKTNCLTCQAIHMGANCKQYQERMKDESDMNEEARRTKDFLEEMVEKGEAIACPTCKVILMKKWGCDWLRCSMCKTEICWVTRGPRWGPGGKGDTSGGCQCGVNGIKCHPKCNYCH